MKLTALDLMVIEKTLTTSLSIIGLFGNTEEKRMEVLGKVLDIMENIEIKLEKEDETE